jgi:NitT/TauT family transport system substrate-binding protein
MNDALKTKQIDGIITFQPYVSIAANDSGNVVLENSSGMLPNHPCCVVVASDDFIKNHNDTVKDIIAIHANATKFINDSVKNGNASEVVKLLPKDIVSNADLEAKSLESFPFISGLDNSFKADVDAFQKLEVDIGILNKTVDQKDLYWEA